MQASVQLSQSNARQQLLGTNKLRAFTTGFDQVHDAIVQVEVDIGREVCFGDFRSGMGRMRYELYI